MKIEFWYIGKTNEKYLQTGMDLYAGRLKHYCKYSDVCVKDVKPATDSAATTLLEGQAILRKIKSEDMLILLDETGKTYSSVAFADQLQRWLNRGSRRIIFLVAGAFGASSELKNRADAMLSMSAMTFSHQMVRLFFTEQLYRAFTILKNEKYHNQ